MSFKLIFFKVTHRRRCLIGDKHLVQMSFVMVMAVDNRQNSFASLQGLVLSGGGICV
jgi:hypothetical protein